MSDITVGSVWVSKKNVSAILVVTDVSDSRVETHWYGDPDNKFEWLKNDFLSKYDLQADMVNNPPHYKDASGIECIEVTRKMQFCGGNCFKYLYRAGQKGSPIEDLEKARWYAVEAHSSSERVSYSAAQDIFKIADSRGREFIAQAMSELARERWARVILFISHEIAYLEGLAND